jgi:hypothetical protein
VQRQPGPLVDVLGGRVEQYYALLDEIPVNGKWGVGSGEGGDLGGTVVAARTGYRCSDDLPRKQRLVRQSTGSYY